MPADDTVLDAGAVLAAVNSLNGIHQSLESGLGSVVTDAEALISGGWAGLAADGFRDHFEQVRTQVEQLLTDAREIVGHIPSVVAELGKVDDGNSEQLGSRAPSSLNL
ncbi:WXG100 family type VII secretion target [Nocardia sp. NPDC024068]|uniref:WXG100 family type VII secretion target n=1 Tax=Nocardia sp. NPDC024068 TaxID=3157197 RepID=UPI0034072285